MWSSPFFFWLLLAAVLILQMFITKRVLRTFKHTRFLVR
uniref:Uncharacterized protein n=1 Tax=Zea mays TaxID=4577 RepID=B6TUY8_MAIZE|nr:hypothetical protein [Zea mays]